MKIRYALTLQCLVLLVAAAFGQASASTLQDADKAVNSGNIQEAIDMYVPLAKAGSTDAMARLRNIYRCDMSFCEQFYDPKMALHWTLAGAESGDSEAQYYLAEMYEKGFGDVVSPSPADAAKWYLRAFEGYSIKAKKGDGEALYKIGFMYEHGQGVDGDLASAHRWMRRAAEQEFVPAMTWLAFAYLAGRAVVQSDGEARMWMAKAMDKNSTLASVYIHADARRVVQLNCSLLVSFTELLASVGDVEAINSLGYAYTYNRNSGRDIDSCVEKDFESARRILRIGVRVCDSYSMDMLGDHYYYGWGVPVNYQEARKWYLRAADLSDSSSMNSLGIMSSHGEGVPTDYVTAHMWFNLSNSEESKFVHSSGAARVNITALEESMSSAQIARAQQMAASWKPQTSCTPASAMELIGGKPAKAPASGPAPAQKSKMKFKDAFAD